MKEGAMLRQAISERVDSQAECSLPNLAARVIPRPLKFENPGGQVSNCVASENRYLVASSG